VSTDGGLTYTEVTPAGLQEGRAWKVAAELDIGELFGSPDRYQAGGYIKKLENGFLSNGNFTEQGTEKSGVNAKVQMTPEDKFLARYDREQVDTLPQAPHGSRIRERSSMRTRRSGGNLPLNISRSSPGTRQGRC